MPSLDHEALVMLFRNRPELAAELLRDVCGVTLPRFRTVATDDSSLSRVTSSADVVTTLTDDASVYGVIVEVQLSCDPDKPFVWPLYHAVLRSRLRAPVWLLVVTVDRAIARWASRPIDTGQPGSPFVPIVVGPDVIPRIDDAQTARSAPELSVLSVFAHAETPDAVPIAAAALEAASGLDDETAKLYYDLIHHALPQAARRALEALMGMPQGYQYQSEFAKKYVAQGRAEGMAKGKAEGKAEALLAIFASRGLAVTPEQHERILGCNDVSTLDAWITRAVAASSVDAALS
jgi:hypothetical protein